MALATCRLRAEGGFCFPGDLWTSGIALMIAVHGKGKLQNAHMHFGSAESVACTYNVTTSSKPLQRHRDICNAMTRSSMETDPLAKHAQQREEAALNCKPSCDAEGHDDIQISYMTLPSMQQFTSK